MKILLVFLFLITGGGLETQGKSALSSQELQQAQHCVKAAVDRLCEHISQLGNSPDNGGASPAEKQRILRTQVKHLFYYFDYRRVATTGKNGTVRRKADTYFNNLIDQSLRKSYRTIYKVEPSEAYLSSKHFNLRKMDVDAEGTTRYVTEIELKQTYIRTAGGSYREGATPPTVVDYTRKKLRLYVLVSSDGDVLCKLGDIFVAQKIR